MTSPLKLLIRMAVRNLMRNRLRSILVLAMVAFTSMISLVASRYASAVMDLWKQGTIDTGSGHVQVHHQNYQQKQEGIDQESSMLIGSAAEKKLLGDQRVVAAVRRFRFEGLIVSDTSSTYFLGSAVEPEGELNVSPRMYNPPHDEGSFVQADDAQSIVIGRALATILKVKIGDDVTILAQTADASVNAVDMRVDGILDVPLPNFSKHAAYMNLARAQELVRMPGLYNELAIRLSSNRLVHGLVRDYGAVFGEQSMTVDPWWKIEPFIEKIESIWNTVAGLLCFLLVISAALTIVNVISMIVNERLVEIGTLAAIGIKPKIIGLLLATEGAAIGLFGGIIGVTSSIVIIAVMGSFGIPFESPFGSGIETVYPTNDFIWCATAVVLSLFVCALCSIPPAMRAAKLEPVMAYRGLASGG